MLNKYEQKVRLVFDEKLGGNVKPSGPRGLQLNLLILAYMPGKSGLSLESFYQACMLVSQLCFLFCKRSAQIGSLIWQAVCFTV